MGGTQGKRVGSAASRSVGTAEFTREIGPAGVKRTVVEAGRVERSGGLHDHVGVDRGHERGRNGSLCKVHCEG